MSQFIAGKQYSCRSICDHECIFKYEVISRTNSMVTLKKADGEVVKKKVQKDSENSEFCYPEGQYSMAPILRAK